MNARYCDAIAGHAQLTGRRCRNAGFIIYLSLHSLLGGRGHWSQLGGVPAFSGC